MSSCYKIVFAFLMVLPIKTTSFQANEEHDKKCIDTLKSTLESNIELIANDIITASIINNPSKLESWISRGMDVNAELVRSHSWTPLILASVYGDGSVAESLLVYHSLDLNHQDKTGKTALIWASNTNNIPAAYAIVKGYHQQFRSQIYGLNLATNKKKLTALHIAANLGHRNIAQILLSSYMVRVNIRDHKHMTPFLHAVISGHHGIVQRFFTKKRSKLKCTEQTWTISFNFVIGSWKYGDFQIAS